jgi:hypothetical protein
MRCHGRRHVERAMNQAEIKSPEIRYNSGFEVSQFTREIQGHPVKTSDFYFELVRSPLAP